MSAAHTKFPARVLLADLEPAVAALLQEWLGSAGITATHAEVNTAASDAALLIVDLPYPRQGGAERLRALSRRWPGVPVLVISAAFFAGVPPRGELARALGVSAVLPAPVARESLLALTHQLLTQTA